MPQRRKVLDEEVSCPACRGLQGHRRNRRCVASGQLNGSAPPVGDCKNVEIATFTPAVTG